MRRKYQFAQNQAWNFPTVFLSLGVEPKPVRRRPVREDVALPGNDLLKTLLERGPKLVPDQPRSPRESSCPHSRLPASRAEVFGCAPWFSIGALLCASAMSCGCVAKCGGTFVEEGAALSGVKIMIVFDKCCACEQHAGDRPNPSVAVTNSIAPVTGLWIKCRHLPLAVGVQAGVS